MQYVYFIHSTGRVRYLCHGMSIIKEVKNSVYLILVNNYQYKIFYRLEDKYMTDKVTKIFIDRLIKDAKSRGQLPWETPWYNYGAFNYFSKHVYTGINRWILPAGEYITKNQINTYNKEHGTNYRFQKGIQWYPVFFVKVDEKEVDMNDLPDEIREKWNGGEGFIGYDSFYAFYFRGGKFVKRRMVRRFYEVAERNFFADENGNKLPSKIETGEVELTLSKPADVERNYFEREGIGRETTSGEAWYSPKMDTIGTPPVNHFKTEQHYYGTVFHEMAHSTGHISRLAREGVIGEIKFGGNRNYSREEVVAELTSALLCAETGIHTYDSQNSKYFDNHTAYIQSWIKYLEDSGDDIIYTMSQAEKAFKFIVGDVENQEACSTDIK